MAVKISTAARNTKLDALETLIGTGATLEIRSGTRPANPAAADAGTLLAEVALPANFMGDASGGTKSLAGTWEDTSADATGIATHFRLKDSGGTVHMDGDVATSGADLNVDNVNFAAGQQFTINSFTWTEGNA